MIQLADHFRSDARRRHTDWLRQQRWFIKAKEDRARREKIEDKQDDDFASLATDLVMATEIQMREFSQRLDSYDEATVIALMENQELLDQLNGERDTLLAQAHVMEDGRRVFKSEGGTFVIDEFGDDVTADELDPMLIGAERPTAETYLATLTEIDAATAERKQLFEFQAKLDEAREAVSDGEISVEEMDEFDTELEALMPASVREQIPGADSSIPANAVAHET